MAEQSLTPGLKSLWAQYQEARAAGDTDLSWEAWLAQHVSQPLFEDPGAVSDWEAGYGYDG